MVAALDLAARGVNVLIVERSTSDTPVVPRANHISARSLEIFRRLGLAAEIRAQGLPDDFPNDVTFTTSLTGYELARLRVPSRNKRFNSVGYVDSGWPTPEPAHRCNQMYFEPVIRRAISGRSGIRTLYETDVDGFSQDSNGVTATGQHRDGTQFTIHADYLIGCEGARSMTRKAIGATFQGIDILSRNRAILVRAPELLKRMTVAPAWMTFFITPVGHGLVHAIDGKEIWCFNLTLKEGDTDLENFNHDPLIRAGIGADVPYETISSLDWLGRRLVADKFSEGRAFIAGDSAHVWMPTAGYGMNAGIADVCNLTWKIAGVLRGWADPAILASYGDERIPVTEQVSQYATTLARKFAADMRTGIPQGLFEESPAGESARIEAGKFLTRTNMELVNCIGLNFAANYSNSRIVLEDGSEPPPFALGEYLPTTIPGCRLPHIFLSDGSSLYDHLGPNYTLIRMDPELEVDSITDAAAARGVPLCVLDVSAKEAGDIYDHSLVLARPDQHIAWRGNACPQNPLAMIDTVRGVRAIGR
jgi:2-polyprenyl-6-methoxyphenol hydroxylase-like FAD-dependent oxidoreductase